jgi:head-tail adaptor
MSDEERNDFPNLLLLCPGHHKRVDDLESDRYTVSKMEEMKEKGSGASATGSDWADDATLATFARNAIRQAVERAVGEMEWQSDREAVTARLSTEIRGRADVAAAGPARHTADDSSRTFDSAAPYDSASTYDGPENSEAPDPDVESEARRSEEVREDAEPGDGHDDDGGFFGDGSTGTQEDFEHGNYLRELASRDD